MSILKLVFCGLALVACACEKAKTANVTDQNFDRVALAQPTDETFMQAMRYNNSGIDQLSKKKFSEAIVSFRKALSEIGDKYASADTMDDTGQKLAFANLEEKKGNLSVAATLLSRVVSSRLDLYRRRLDLK